MQFPFRSRSLAACCKALSGVCFLRLEWIQRHLRQFFGAKFARSEFVQCDDPGIFRDPEFLKLDTLHDIRQHVTLFCPATQCPSQVVKTFADSKGVRSPTCTKTSHA